MDVTKICGEIVYTATFDGAPATASTMPTYSSSSMAFGIYSEDTGLIGEHRV